MSRLQTRFAELKEQNRAALVQAAHQCFSCLDCSC